MKKRAINATHVAIWNLTNNHQNYLDHIGNALCDTAESAKMTQNDYVTWFTRYTGPGNFETVNVDYNGFSFVIHYLAYYNGPEDVFGVPTLVRQILEILRYEN